MPGLVLTGERQQFVDGPLVVGVDAVPRRHHGAVAGDEEVGGRAVSGRP